jgi:hypothetical protein
MSIGDGGQGIAYNEGERTVGKSCRIIRGDGGIKPKAMAIKSAKLIVAKDS